MQVPWKQPNSKYFNFKLEGKMLSEFEIHVSSA